MKTKYKYIHFEESEEKGTATYWICRNNKTNTRLGIVEYYPTWKQYTFEPYEDCVFNIDCLNDIVDFMKQLPRKAVIK